MATPVIMPKFGMAQEDGTIIRWLKQEGEPVEKGETLLEVQTDKVDMEVESPATGVLRDIRFGPDVTVPVTTVIALVASAADEARIRSGEPPVPAAGAAVPPLTAPETPARSDGRVTPVAQRVAAAHGLSLQGVEGSGPAGRIMRADVERAGELPSPASATLPAPEPPPPSDAGPRRATPAARRLAREAGLTLEAIAGSGPAARVQAADVERAKRQQQASSAAIHAPQGAARLDAPSATAAAAVQSGAPLRGVRRTIARRVVQSWSAIPHIFLTSSFDMTRAEAVRAQLGPDVEALGERLTPTVLLARATAAALLRHPRLNAHLVEEAGELLLVEHAEVHLGLAVALAEGLVVPVVHNAHTLGLATLAQQAGDLARRARANQLLPADIEGGTFTISSLGAFPVDHFTALIFPPQVAILAVGRATTQPMWDGSTFLPRPTLQVTLSADHRAVDGAVAAAFLADLKRLVEEPERLLL
jgi:pyruvate dehydrogenase E2 component (dihydrolipoamide acetyltransferase)